MALDFFPAAITLREYRHAFSLQLKRCGRALGKSPPYCLTRA
jgi:hypothetical protein